MTSRLTRQRNTFGRTMSLRFTVSATISATAGLCVMALPNHRRHGDGGLPRDEGQDVED